MLSVVELGKADWKRVETVPDEGEEEEREWGIAGTGVSMVVDRNKVEKSGHMGKDVEASAGSTL